MPHGTLETRPDGIVLVHAPAGLPLAQRRLMPVRVPAAGDRPERWEIHVLGSAPAAGYYYEDRMPGGIAGAYRSLAAVKPQRSENDPERPTLAFRPTFLPRRGLLIIPPEQDPTPGTEIKVWQRTERTWTRTVVRIGEQAGPELPPDAPYRLRRAEPCRERRPDTAEPARPNDGHTGQNGTQPAIRLQTELTPTT